MPDPQVQGRLAPASAPATAQGASAPLPSPQFITAFILGELPKHLAEHDGTADYEELAKKCIHFVTALNPLTPKADLSALFKKAHNAIDAELSVRPSDIVRLYEVILNKLFREIERQLSQSRNVPRPETSCPKVRQ